MSMDAKTVKKAATLARIHVAEPEVPGWVKQLGGIMNWIEQLKEVKTDGVEPLASVADIKLKLRKDEVTDGADPAKVVSNAPEEVENYYVVPKVVE